MFLKVGLWAHLSLSHIIFITLFKKRFTTFFPPSVMLIKRFITRLNIFQFFCCVSDIFVTKMSGAVSPHKIVVPPSTAIKVGVLLSCCKNLSQLNFKQHVTRHRFVSTSGFFS